MKQTEKIYKEIFSVALLGVAVFYEYHCIAGTFRKAYPNARLFYSG